MEATLPDKPKLKEIKPRPELRIVGIEQPKMPDPLSQKTALSLLSASVMVQDSRDVITTALSDESPEKESALLQIAAAEDEHTARLDAAVVVSRGDDVTTPRQDNIFRLHDSPTIDDSRSGTERDEPPKQREYYEPLPTANLDTVTRENIRRELRFLEDNSGLLGEEHPMVKELQETLNRMQDPLSPPSRILVARDAEGAEGFVLPDGTMVLTMQLIRNMDTVEEVVAIMAHEQVHFEKKHHKKRNEPSGDESDSKIKEAGQWMGRSRLHEAQADLALIAKLDGLGIDTLSFESAIQKIRRHRAKSKSAGVQAVHGYDHDRALNTILAHSLVDFPSSSLGGESRRPIPDEWKTPFEHSVLERLDELSPPDARWKELLLNASPHVLRAHAQANALEIKNDIPSTEIPLPLRHEAYRKLGAVLDLVETRIAESQVPEDQKRRAFLLAATDGLGISSQQYASITTRRAFSMVPVDPLAMRTDLSRNILPSDVTEEGFRSFIDLHQQSEVYAVAGVPIATPGDTPDLVGSLLGEEIFPQVTMRFDKGQTLRGREYPVQEMLTYVDSLHDAVAGQIGDKAATEWREQQLNEILTSFVSQNRRPWDIGNKELTTNTSELLRHLVVRYKTEFSTHQLDRLAKDVGETGTMRKMFRAHEYNPKIKRTAFETFLKDMRPEDPLFMEAITGGDPEAFSQLLFSNPAEFQWQLAYLKQRDGLTPKQDVAVIKQVIESYRQVQIDGDFVPNRETVKEMERHGFSAAIDGITPDVLRSYQQLKFALDTVAILATHRTGPDQVSRFEKFFASKRIAEVVGELPTVLLDDLARTVIADGQHSYGEKAEDEIVPARRRFDMGSTTRDISGDDRTVIAKLPFFSLLRDKMLAGVDQTKTTDIVNVYTHLTDIYHDLHRRGMSSTFWGSSPQMAEVMAPVSLLLLKDVQQLGESQSPKELQVLHSLLQDYLPSDADSRQLLGVVGERVVRALPYEDALEFIAVQAEAGHLDLGLVNQFIETRINTGEDYHKSRDVLARVIDTFITKPPAVTGAAVTVDVLSELVDGREKLEALETAFASGRIDTEFRTGIADYYWNAFVRRERYTMVDEMRGYRVDRNQETGAVDINGPSAHTFPTFDDTIDRLQSLNSGQKFAALRKMLLSYNGVLLNPKQHGRLVELVAGNMQEDPTLTPLLKNVFRSTLSAADPVRMFTPIADAVSPFVFRKTPEKGSNDGAVTEIVKMVNHAETAIGVINKTDDKKYVAGVLGKSSEEILQAALAESPATATLYQNYQDTIASLQEDFGVTPETAMPEATADTAIPPVEVILRFGQAMGPVGKRFLQVLGHYIDLPPQFEEPFSEVYDSNPGQSKFSAFSTIESLAQTDEVTRRYLDDELVSIDERIGGGSIMTAFKVTSRNEAGELVREVLKVKNPNAERFVMETLVEARKVLGDLKEKGGGQLRNYEVAGKLLDTIEDWVLSDIRDETFLTLDPLFRQLHDGFESSAGMTVRVGEVREPNNAYLKREAFIEGDTFNKVVQAEQKSGINEQTQRIAVTTAELFSRQLTLPAYYDAPGKPVYLVLSDIHPGNGIQSADQNTYYPIDRSFYLKLHQEDISLLKSVLSDSPPQEKLASIVSYCLSEPGNQGRGLNDADVARDVYAAIAKREASDRVRGRGASSELQLMSRVSRELTARGIQLPLKFDILLKDCTVVGRQLERAGKGKLADYLFKPPVTE